MMGRGPSVLKSFEPANSVEAADLDNQEYIYIYSHTHIDIDIFIDVHIDVD
jgi:hypothetical protein